MRFLYQFMVGLAWFYENVVRRITRPFVRAALHLFRGYRALWERVVYLETGHFSRVRAGLMVTATAAVFYVAVPVLLFVLHAGLYLLTAKQHEVFLTQSQEIYPDEDVHAARGCEELPCTDQNAVYYRIRPHGFHQAWSILRGQGLFYPDYVAAAVPPGISRCTVRSYGLRVKFLMRQADMYPDLLQARCDKLG